ncbi:transposase [Acuticoccus sediminis]|uniref:transposase n=1 Tax=Acuticoccus sediminis TaxID=2184697 RepID=UPI001CFECE44
MPVSIDILLRTVRRGAPAVPAPWAIGIDDWAWRKRHRYGALNCDRERRLDIDQLPDREPATVAAWLAERPSIEIIARDRGGGYGAGAAKGRTEAVQVADRHCEREWIRWMVGSESPSELQTNSGSRHLERMVRTRLPA